VRTTVPSGFLTVSAAESAVPTRAARLNRPRQPRDAASRHQGFDPGQAVRLLRAGQVPERQHRVGLAAAEIGLQLDRRIAAPPAQAAHRVGQQAL
jgi:hypothetical protein